MQINNLRFVADWRLEDLEGRNLHVSFLPLLQALQKSGKLTEAAKSIDVSYRLAWNILKEAEVFFGHPVTLMERGRGASLTELGRVLLQANQRIEARLHTQMESVAMELNASVHRVLSDQIGVMRIYASHGYAVALIPDHLQNYQAELHYHGPEDALRALNTSDCVVAGFNLPLHHRVPSLIQRYRELLNPSKVAVLRFIKRQQGLMVSPANKHTIRSLNDLGKKGVRFINRQPLSGTRELLDHLLIKEGINASQVVGYENHEYTHSAVAAHVATGMADVGFGVQAAASRFDLDFIPVTEDCYFWAIRRESLDNPEIQAFIDTLSNDQLQAQINQLPGYECDACGEALLIETFLS